MNRATFMIFAVLCFFALLWGTDLMFPKGSASAIVLVAATALGIGIVRPGWNFRSLQCGYNVAVLYFLSVAHY